MFLISKLYPYSILAALIVSILPIAGCNSTNNADNHSSKKIISLTATATPAF